jgi:hypothetical protein
MPVPPHEEKPMRPSTPARVAVVAIAAVLATAALLGNGQPAPHAAGKAPAARSADGYGDREYWRFADRIVDRLDALWDARAGRYDAGSGGVDTMLNADLLLVHAAAALARHEGPARNDARARALAHALTASPPYVDRPGRRSPGAHAHAPGWVSSMSTTVANQHLVIDAQVVDGLTHGWLARRELRLPRPLAARIAAAVHRTARGSYWRWPALRLNQLNWHALVSAADATVAGERRRFARDLRRHIERFAAGVRTAGATAGNLGPGLRFHYLPHFPRSSAFNIDSAEYASIVASFTRFYGAARRAGMPLPSPRALHLLRGWMRRVLAGYWTHSGYLNWDTGLSFRRWHQVKKLGLAQQALVGLASAGELQPHARYGRWAKWMLDRGFAFYERVARRSPGGLVPGVLYGVNEIPQAIGNVRLGASRMAANAARAVLAGLGDRRGEQPPPLYAFDPDVGRLAVTTPAYSTAIVAVNQGAFPYGGIELARLLDGDGEVAAGIGGRPPAAFGLVVRDAAGRRVLATQLPRRSVDRRVMPLRLTRAPQGVGATAAAAVGRAYAGAFGELRATGTVSTPALLARTTHRFRAAAIETTWSLRYRRGAVGRYRADVLFPSWGRGARVVAVARDGRRLQIGRSPVRLARVAAFCVESARSGYAIVPSGSARATARLLRPAPQSSAPRPGPTLAVRIADGSTFAPVRLTVRLDLRWRSDTCAEENGRQWRSSPSIRSSRATESRVSPAVAGWASSTAPATSRSTASSR